MTGTAERARQQQDRMTTRCDHDLRIMTEQRRNRGRDRCHAARKSGSCLGTRKPIVGRTATAADTTRSQPAWTLTTSTTATLDPRRTKPGASNLQPVMPEKRTGSHDTTGGRPLVEEDTAGAAVTRYGPLITPSTALRVARGRTPTPTRSRPYRSGIKQVAVNCTRRQPRLSSRCM